MNNLLPRPPINTLCMDAESPLFKSLQILAKTKNLSLIQVADFGLPAFYNPTSPNQPQGVIHLDSALLLAQKRDNVFQDLSEWVRLQARHVFNLSLEIMKLNEDVQDKLGKDLAMLASCRESDSLILGPIELESSLFLESLRMWLTPKVKICLFESHRKTTPIGNYLENSILEWFENGH